MIMKTGKMVNTLEFKKPALKGGLAGKNFVN